MIPYHQHHDGGGATNQLRLILSIELFFLKFMPYHSFAFGCLQAGQCWTGILYVPLNRVKQSNIHKNNSFGSLSQLQNTYVSIRHISLQTVPDYKRKSFFLSLSVNALDFQIRALLKEEITSCSKLRY